MYSNEETIWVNQNLLHYKDTVYNSGSALEIVLTTNTTDFVTFNPPTLNLFLKTENVRRTCILNYYNICDLDNSISSLLSNQKSLFRDKIELVRKINDKCSLKFGFKESQSGEEVIVIALITGESDFGFIILSKIMFSSLLDLFKSFKSSYIQIGLDFMSRSIITKISNDVKELKGLVKTLPSFISKISSIDSVNHESTKIETKKTENIIQEDFDSFLSDTIDSVTIPEIHEKQEKTYSGEFIKVLEGDISNMEHLMHNCFISVNPIQYLIDKISSVIKVPPDFIFLPGITDDEFKSATYIGHLFFKRNLQKSITTQSPISIESPIIYYNVDQAKTKSLNIDLAFDFIIINAYLKVFRGKLETKISSTNITKSAVYLSSRCYLDILTVSFLKGKDLTSVISVISNKFKEYQKSGFFSSLEEVLSAYNCSSISITDIIDMFIKPIFDKFKGDIPSILDLHDALYESKIVTLPSKSNLTIEQITNETILYEVNKEFEKHDPINISNDVTDILKKQEPTEKENNLIRFVKEHEKEIPETFLTAFNEEIKKFVDKPFDFKSSTFPLAEFGDSIIKVLYVWNPDQDPKVSKTYSYLVEKVKKTIMSKDSILNVSNNSSSNESEDGDWFNALEV